MTDTSKIVTEYEATWHFAHSWPGEYPPRFSITRNDVVLLGRSEMRLSAVKDVRCPVPKFATFSPWNHTRNTADDLQYRTVTKVLTVTITDAVEVSASSALGDRHLPLNLQKGDTLQFLFYIGEGFALYRYQGENYQIEQAAFADKAQIETGTRADDLWLELPAEHGGRGWVLFSDAIETDGVIESEIEAFGTANDLPDPAKLTLEGIGFVSGGIELTDASKQILKALGDQLWRVSDVVFEIGGHTDSIGSSESNQQLSFKRAAAVADYLVDEVGLDFNILRVKGYGEAQPIADNGTAEGRAANRRVELTVLDL